MSKYKAGDVVEVVSNHSCHEFEIGAIALLLNKDGVNSWLAASKNTKWSILEDDLKLVSEETKVSEELPMSTPEHYNQGGIEPKDFINSHNLNFNLGNCVKYVCRAEYKGSQEQDLKKAIDYLHFELERISKLNK